MPKYFDSKGNPYHLNQQIGRGGEGTVFFCPDDMSIVAKIYHEPIDEDKAKKLRWMAENSDEKLLKVAAWIVDTLHETPGGPVVGFLMPNVRAKEIHELYSLKSRRVHFPDATWQFLVHAAANVARAFHNLHRHGHVMGDVNHGNCVVLADGTVKLIDCDSYSIKTDKFRYRCEVGVATHLAPELQGLDLSEIERTQNHDNFGLAVIVFQLLFLGRHPFAGNYLGSEDKSLEECIRERRFAYGENAAITRVKQPPGTLKLEAVSPRIATMFERAFLTEDRPEAREWIEALEDLGNSLKQCVAHIGHFYFDGLPACPWCEIENKTGLMLFPFVGSKGQSDEAFNIFTVESLLAGLEVPRDLPAVPVRSPAQTVPSENARKIQDQRRARLWAVSMIQFIVVLLTTVLVGAGAGFFVGAVMMIGFLIAFHNSDRNNRESIEADLYDAQLKWKQIEKEWNSQIRTNQIEDDLETVRERVAEHHDLNRRSRERVRAVADEVLHYKLNRYLTGFKIAGTKIEGVTSTAKSLMREHGITTAADIEGADLESIHLLDTTSREAIRDWREELERKFEFDPDKEIPKGDLMRVEGEVSERRRRLEREIEQILVSLRSSTTMVQQSQRMLSSRASEVSQALAQAERDLETMGTSTPLIVSLIFITALIPMFGAAIQTKPGLQGGAGSGPGRSTTTYATNVVRQNDGSVADGLSDQEIAAMGSSSRQLSAEWLTKNAKILASAKSYEAALLKFRYALRFDNKNDEARFGAADALFHLGQSREALNFLNEIRSGRDGNVDGFVLRARIQLALGSLKLAQEAADQAYSMDSKSAEVLLCLAMIYRERRQFSIAEAYLNQSINAEPSYSEAYYELGITYSNQGKTEKAQQMFEALKSMDSDLAERLRKAAKLPDIPQKESDDFKEAVVQPSRK